jgi:tellurite resistance protein
MTRFTQWIKQAVHGVIDPERADRVNALCAAIERDLASKRQGFTLHDAVKGIAFKPGDLEEAKETVYRRVIGRGWQDGQLTQSEQVLARWVVRVLELSPDRAHLVNVEFARNMFSYAFAKAMEDGRLDVGEEESLNTIAATVGMKLADFVRHFFAKEAEGFLRAIFAAAVSQGGLRSEDWRNLVDVTARLGVSHDDLLIAIQPQARRLVEQVLADAKADGVVTAQEEATVRWLLENLRLPAGYVTYVVGELEFLRAVADIREGKLPCISPPAHLGVRAGELVHLHVPAVWRHTRLLKSGAHVDDHQGWLTLTDNRLLFSSPTRSEVWNLRKVVAHQGGTDWMSVEIDGKAASQFFFGAPLPLGYLIFQSAVAMANQTLTRPVDTASMRYIPREVRQRVWQRYGGRCVECSAEDYLEFDHIVPVAKGGSNSENNVQLLCRRCNLKKSDHI